MAIRRLETRDEAETEALGARLAPSLPVVRLIYVRGPLGAGKTTFVRGLLRGLGHDEAVRSPTFTLVEPYRTGGVDLYHFDLYRLKDPEELEFLGMRDYLGSDAVCVIEWPERAGTVLPAPDIDVMIRPTNNQGRAVELRAHTQAGNAALARVDEFE
ncbi:MAG TPA: tRNA (adenosine(37)-N6)-threonylcarbamoyltransferase complex ATPase subunit type 1 TsaE [Burkholderiales bacterium]